MDNKSAECDLRAEGGMPLAPSSQTGGGSAGVEEKDGLSEPVAFTLDTDGPTEPGNPPAKSPPQTVREFERAMRELGYSKSAAREIVNHGFKGLAQADSADDLSTELVSLLKRTLDELDFKESL